MARRLQMLNRCCVPSLSPLAVDSETACFYPGNMAPKDACWTWAHGRDSGIVHHTEAREFLRVILQGAGKDHVLIGHNIEYDTAVLAANYPDLLPEIFAAYDRNGITCTLRRQQLLDIRDGRRSGYVDKGTGEWRKSRYGLTDLSARYGFGHMEKDEWRLKYGELRDLPLDLWPEGAKAYPILDAVRTLDVYKAQGTDYVADEFEEAKAFFTLQLCSVWGIKTSPEGVAKLRAETQAEQDELRAQLVAAGLVRSDGSRNMKAAQDAMAAAGSKRMTATGRYALDADACEAVDDPLMKAYGDFSTLNYVLTKDIPMLEKGVTTPAHTRFNLQETTRTSSSGPNIQNIRRQAGIRECFIPREGWCYAQTDYPALELRTLAEVCYEWLGHSSLGDALTRGADPHAMVAAQILNCTPEDITKRIEGRDHEADNARQTGKVANFGFPGGLGPKRFVDFARSSYSVTVTESEARALKQAWLSAWPEMAEYHALIKQMEHPQLGFCIEHVHTGVLRSGMSYTVACNSPFQSLGASCAKRGFHLVSKACYTDTSSPLFGARPVNFVHDEIITEFPYKRWGRQRTHDAAMEMARLFRAGAQSLLRVPIPCKSVLMMLWSKEARATFEDGLLVPWTGTESAKV